jgi:uncharacterized BrkB/YihY/UPF0761 family membrane protein
VPWQHLVGGSMLVVLLVAVSGFFLGRQVQALRDLRRLPLEEDEERRLRRQTYRRLSCSGLLLLLGFLLAAALILLEPPAQQLADQNTPLTEEQKDLARIWAGFWIGFLLILLAVVLIAGFDLWATRRHALREQRKIQADRRAMLEQQIERLRHERNDHG